MSSFGGEKFDLSSQRWRKRNNPTMNPASYRYYYYFHELVRNDGLYEPFLCGMRCCAFCQADLIFDRNLEEILYHFEISNSNGCIHSTLIENWKNGKDAWNNPIGENIKG